MDSSPLVKARDHARAAAVATRQQASDSTVAISEHTLAAGEFAVAGRSATSIEVLRTLKLLEDHHRRLAEILRMPHEPSEPTADDTAGEKSPRSEKDRPDGEDGGQQTNREPPAARPAHVAGHAQPRRMPSRELSSSIASKLASARGVRSKYRGQPLSPSVSNDQAPGNVDSHPRRDESQAKMHKLMDHGTGRPTWVPPSLLLQESSGRAKGGPASEALHAKAASDDDGGYGRFYSTFGSLINKISAPLAFAGLPLIQEEATSSELAPELAQLQPSAGSPPSSRRKLPSSVPSGSGSPHLDPDLSRIFSKATMQALARDGHASSDSFYVVPTSGHTMSYANILMYAEKEKRRHEASAHGEAAPPTEDDDDFVDARETPFPLSPGSRRKVVRKQAEQELRNTVEELSLENQSLKGMLDNVSKRLHAFEVSSQHSAMALAESLRTMQPGSPSVPPAGRPSDVEEQLAAVVKQMERLERDNRKMQKTLDKYREKWDLLKAGAKARREAQASDSVEDARQS
ncbi:hypothetical protein DCS_00665 [Drechmeria coniospora]|uniref:Uncharacterized protein n=1 Tax=Drechmeria coniospora TaxID=98403 RepID=A0A151GQZ3_DRECN|nr:hypothetical protein DCS_00665 [Drechmeria coniospora]KYK59535.1 hypothetical protein DCS_00665 [Drechmeria coniospora]